MDAPFNRYGGLTMIPLPGFETLAYKAKEKIENFSDEWYVTPVDIVVPEFGCRASGEPFLRLGKNHIGGHDCVVLTSGPGTYEMLGQLLFLLRYLVGRRAQRVTVVMPYFPLGRSDKDEGTKEFALPPLVIDLMMGALYQKLDRIISVDLHAPQVVMSGRTGLITEVSLVRRILKRVLQDALHPEKEQLPLCLAFPDDGACKRVEEAVQKIAEEFNLDFSVVYGSKRRDSSVISHVKEIFGDVSALRGARVLSVDDEIATGRTNIETALFYKNQFGAAEVWAIVTHGVFCRRSSPKHPGAEELFALPDCPVDRIYCAETIPLENRSHLHPLLQSEKIITIPWWEDLAWIVYHQHWDLSIREMR